MVTVDPRVGSKEIKPLLDTLNVPNQFQELSSADFSFEGNGPRGKSLVGVERKTIRDLLQCMRDARFVDVQLPRMIQQYDIRYLFIEGLVRANPMSGILEEAVSRTHGLYWYEVTLGRTRFMWEHLDHYISSLEWSPIKVRRTNSDFDTARHLKSLYTYYHREWRDHKSLRALHYEPWSIIPMEDRENPVRCVAREFPGIGVEKSLSCTAKWKSVFDMVVATRQDWQDIPGVGPGISTKVFNWIHGITENGDDSSV